MVADVIELSTGGVPTLEKCCELCTVMRAREKCASARVQVGVVPTPSVALTAVATGSTHGFDTWITLYFSGSTTMRCNSKEKEICTYFIQAPPLSQRPGYREAN